MAEAVQSKAVASKDLLHIAVIMLFMYGFQFLPPIGQITPVGMQVLGIFIGTLYGWSFYNLLWSSVMGLIAFGLSDAYTMTQVFNIGFGDEFVLMIVGLLFVAAYINQSGSSLVIVSWLVRRKVAVGKPWLLIFLFFLGCLVISILSDATLGPVLMLPLYRTLAKSVGIEPYDKLNSVFITGILCASCLGDIAMPFKFMPLFFWRAFSETFSIPVDFAAHFLVVFPAVVAILIVYTLACKYVVRADASILKDAASHECFDVDVSKHQLTALAFIGTLLVSLILPSLMPESFFLTQFLNTLGYAGTVFAFLALMMVVKVEEKALIDIPKLAKDFDWSIYFLLAYFILLATMLPSDAAGIKATLTTIIEPIFEGLSAYTFVITLVLVVAVLTNFINNMIVALLFISILGVSGVQNMDVNLMAIAVLILLSSVYAMFSPAANPVAAIMFGQRDLIHFRPHVVHGLKCCAVIILFSITILYWYLSAFM